MKEGFTGIEKAHKKLDSGTYDSDITKNYFKDLDKLKLEGNPELKKTIKKNIEFAEKAAVRAYMALAGELNISVEKCKEGLQERIETIIKNSDFFRATQVDVLEKVLNVDGRFKSQFEVDKSDGRLDRKFRADLEEELYGFVRRFDGPYELSTQQRAIYGYFIEDKNGFVIPANEFPKSNLLIYYGGVNVKIKKKRALEKATITFDDTISTRKYSPPTPAAKPHFVSLYHNSREHYEGNTKAASYMHQYTEAQFHGQLTVDDIESIHISPKNGMSPKDIEMVREIFKKFKDKHPRSTIKLIEY